jgi:outer membrane protein
MIHGMTSIDATSSGKRKNWPAKQMKKQAAPSAGWCRLAVLALVLGSAVAMAEEPPGTISSDAVTLEQAARSALDHYQPYHIIQETLSQLQQQRKQALSAILPTLTLGAAYTQRPGAQYTTSIVDPTQQILFYPRTDQLLNFTVSQPLFTGGRAVGGFKEATALMHAGEENVKQNREELLMNVAQAFYGVLKAHKRTELFEAERQRLEEHRREAEARVKVGDVTKTVLLRAEAELAGAQAELVRARSDDLIVREQLALLTNLPSDAALATPSAQVAPAISDTLVTDAQLHRPEWLSSRYEEQAAERQVQVARAGFFPTLSLQLTYQIERQTPDTAFFVSPNQYATLQLQFPLFEGGLQLAKVREANSQLQAAALNTEYLQMSIKVEVRNAMRDVQTLAGVVEQYTAQVAFAKENYELTSRQFAVGLATNLDVLDANGTLLSAEQQLAAATFDHDVAVLRVYKSLGRLSDHLLGQ